MGLRNYTCCLTEAKALITIDLTLRLGAETSLASVEESATITITGDSYHTTIADVFVPALHGINGNHVWFQQVGAIDLLRQTFDGLQ